MSGLPPVLVGLFVSASLLAYLTVALLKPEKF